MTETILTALIATGAAIAASAVTGYATYRAALVGFEARRTKARLLESQKNLQFLIEVEKHLTEDLAAKTGEAKQELKRLVRARISDKLGRPLGQSAEPARLSRSVEKLAATE